MVIIHAKGTANIDGIILLDQEVTVYGESNTIDRIVYGDVTFDLTKDAISELLKYPEDYWVPPEYPKPHTLKAAYVAIITLWALSDIKVDGEIKDPDEEPYVPGSVY